MNNNKLQECHRLVWAFRKEIEPYWATPDPLNSLRYAFCEAAEAMDAWLRAERPNDSRNNERQNDVLDELADCAIMLLTAYPEGIDDANIYFQDYDFMIELISKYISTAIVRMAAGGTWASHASEIEDAICFIANYPGMELKQRIQGRLARIAFKHMPLFKSAELIEKLHLPANNLPYDSVNHPLVNE